MMPAMSATGINVDKNADADDDVVVWLPGVVAPAMLTEDCRVANCCC